MSYTNHILVTTRYPFPYVSTAHYRSPSISQPFTYNFIFLFMFWTLVDFCYFYFLRIPLNCFY